MRAILLLISFVIVTSINSQKNDRIEELKNYFKNKAINTIVTYKGKDYGQETLANLTDSLLADLGKHKIPSWKIRHFAPYYATDSKFKNIIDEIIHLPLSNESDFEFEMDNTEQQISKLSHPLKKLYCLLAISSYYKSLHDTIAVDYVVKIVDKFKSNDFENFEETGKFFKVLADHISDSDPPLSLKLYFEAFDAYKPEQSNSNNFGDLEVSIAELYSKRNVYAYKARSIQHYKKAAHYYSLAGNISDSLISLLKAAKLMIWNSKTTPSDIVNYLYFNKKPQQTMWDDIARKNLDSSIDFALSVAYNTYQYIDSVEGKKANQSKYQSSQATLKLDDLYFYVNLLLGNCFLMVEDSQTAQSYFHQSFSLGFSNWKKYDYTHIAESLDALSWTSSYNQATESVLKYINTEIEIFEDVDDVDNFNWATLNKAHYLMIMGKYEAGIHFARTVIDQFRSRNNDKVLYGWEEGCNVMYQLFDRLVDQDEKLIDSANFYYDQYNRARSFYLEEFDLMSQSESDYITKEHEQRVANMTLSLDKLGARLFESSARVHNLENKERQLIFDLRLKADSVNTLKKIISKNRNELLEIQEERARALREAAAAKLETKKAKQEAENLNIAKTKILTVGSAVLLIIICMGIFMIFRNRTIRDQLKVSIDRMDAEARNLSHNIKDDYTDFLCLIADSDFDKAGHFASLTGDYLGLVTNKYDYNENWTIAKELEILEAFCKVREASGLELHILKDFQKIQTDLTVMVSDVFTTLLHNSIKNRDKNRTLIFKICATVQANFVYFEISDNGIPSELKNYIRADRPNKGLALLKRRVEAYAKFKKVAKVIKSPFKIEANEGIGTTIIIILPYETKV